MTSPTYLRPAQITPTAVPSGSVVGVDTSARPRWYYASATWPKPGGAALYITITRHTGPDEALDELVAGVGRAQQPDTSFSLPVASYASEAVRGIVDEVEGMDWPQLQAWHAQMCDGFLTSRAPLTPAEHRALTTFRPVPDRV